MRVSFLVLAIAIPAVFGDATGSQVDLAPNSTFSLESGTPVSTGGDIVFTGTAISFVGAASADDLDFGRRIS